MIDQPFLLADLSGFREPGASLVGIDPNSRVVVVLLERFRGEAKEESAAEIAPLSNHNWDRHWRVSPWLAEPVIRQVIDRAGTASKPRAASFQYASCPFFVGGIVSVLPVFGEVINQGFHRSRLRASVARPLRSSWWNQGLSSIPRKPGSSAIFSRNHHKIAFRSPPG